MTPTPGSSGCRLERVHELAREIGELQRVSVRTLLDVRSRSVAALDNLVEEVRNLHVRHLRRELARVLRTDAIVLRRGPDERHRIRDTGLEVVQRRDGFQEGAL